MNEAEPCNRKTYRAHGYLTVSICPPRRKRLGVSWRGQLLMLLPGKLKLYFISFIAIAAGAVVRGIAVDRSATARHLLIAIRRTAADDQRRGH